MTSEGCASERRAELWNQVAHSVARRDGGKDLLDVVCVLAHRCLGVSGAAITLHSGSGDREITATSGPLTVIVDELQFASGEGPGLTAFTENRPVLVPELDDAAELWPGFASLASEAGIAAMFAFPLTIAGARLATLDLHRTRPGPLTGKTLTDAHIVGGLAELALTCEHGRILARLQDGESHYLLIHRATGMLVEQLNVSIADASARLRAYAFAHRRSPRAVADDIMAGRLQLDRATP